MPKSIFTYFLLFIFGFLLIPKNLVHECERQHKHEINSEHEHSVEGHFDNSDKCSICDLQVFPFTLPQIAVSFFLEQKGNASYHFSTQSTDIDVQTKFLRGPPANA